MENLIYGISNDAVIKVLIIALFFDIFLGSLRAIKEHKWNSTVGINGILRKVGMIGSVLFLFLCDRLLNLNFLGFIPEEVLGYFNIKTVGACDLFSVMFILYEITSVLKNMVLCEIPVPKKLRQTVDKLLSDMTTELENKK